MSSSIKSWAKAFMIAFIVFGFSVMIAVVAVKTLSYSSDVITQINEVIKKPSYDYLKSVTVRIIKKTDIAISTGTGSVIKITNDYTYILTNQHVAPIEAEKLYVVDEYGRETKATILSNCLFADLALIRVDGKLKDKREIKKIGNIDHSEKVYSVGMYLGYSYIYTEGTMAGYDESNNFVMNMPGSHGCSGSGVFNVAGELVAVVFAGNYIQFPIQIETAKLLCINTFDMKMFLHMTRELIK